MNALTSSADRKHALTRAVENRLEQGYEVESQNDTQAILRMKGRRRRFRPSTMSRQLLTIDDHGRPSFKKID
jgi:hypothetical protein